MRFSVYTQGEEKEFEIFTFNQARRHYGHRTVHLAIAFYSKHSFSFSDRNQHENHFGDEFYR